MKRLSILLILTILSANLAAQTKETTSSSKTVTGEDISKYPTLDITNSLTGVIPGLFVTENHGATGVRFGTANTSLQLRAFSNPIFIVDGVTIEDITEIQLSPEDIESVSVMTDILDKVSYGPEAARGAVIIKTTRGIEKGRVVKAGFEKGVDIVDRLPQWTNGVEYANLNNLARANANERAGAEVYKILYDQTALDAFAKNDPYDLNYPNVDYASLMLKNTRDYHKAYVSLVGGGDAVKYSANLDYANQGDILKVGANSNYNRLGAKMNMDIRVNSRLNVNFSFFGSYSIRQSPLSGYGATGNAYEMPTILYRIQTTPAVEYPLCYKEDEKGNTTYIISQEYPNHPYATVAQSGSYTESFRSGLTRGLITYDLSALLQGLRSETMIGFKVAYLTRLGQGADYIGYLYDKASGEITPTSHVGESATSKSTYLWQHTQGLHFSETLKYDRAFGYNKIDAGLSVYLSNQVFSSTSVYHKQQNFIGSAKYSFKDKYLAELALNYAGSSAIKKDKRYRLFPSAGLGWVMSEEPFLKSSTAVDYLKLRAQAGFIGYESYSSQYLWQSHYTKTGNMTFGPSANSSSDWLGSANYVTTATVAEALENSNLGWEVNKEFCVGLDATLFKGLNFSYTHFHTARQGIVTDVSSTLPLFYGSISLYDNYNGMSYWGDEISLSYGGQKGDFRYRVGGNFMYTNDRYDVYLESSNLESRVGHGIGDFYGYDYIGRFSSQEEIDNSPVQKLGSTVCIGDLKYRDVTGDGVVDSNDRIFIGNTRPKYQYAVNLYLAWKGLEFTVVGTGKAGFDTMLENSWFQGGWGNVNYSTYVRDHVASGDYPGFSYVKATNNFVTSQYWMTDGSFFKIQNVELAYNFKMFRIFARGANLLTISKIQGVDPENINAGISSYPLFRTITGGISINIK